MIFQHSTTLNAKIITCLASSLFGGGKGGGGGGGGGGELETRVKLHSPPHFAAHSRTYKTTSYAGYKKISRQTLNVLLPGRLTYEEIVTR